MNQIEESTLSEKVKDVVERHTNRVRGHPEVTEKMRANIARLVVIHNVYDEGGPYSVEKLAKMFAEPIYYLRSSLYHKQGINHDNLKQLSEAEIEAARKKHDEVGDKLLVQVHRQFRFYNVFLNNVASDEE